MPVQANFALRLDPSFMYTLAWHRAPGQGRTPVVTGESTARRRWKMQALAVAIWTILAIAGLAALTVYSFTGNIPAHAAAQWPASSQLSLDSARPVLVLFLHPRCPCSAASITALDRVLSRHPGAFRVYAVLTVPPGVDADWEVGRNLEAARSLPETSLVFDRGGTLARSFGAGDSGTLLAFGPDGVRLFVGGITASRGHEGESLGVLVLRDLATGRTPRQSDSPVFGCPLLGPESASARGVSP